MGEITEDNLINLIKEKFPRFNGYWDSYISDCGSGDGIIMQMLPFIEYVVEIIKSGDENEIKRIFDLVEFLMCNGNVLVQTAIATGFLEGLLNKDPEEIQFIKFRKYLGKETIGYCRAWDIFTGVMTKGLHDDENK
jgi:hypothetical protein